MRGALGASRRGLHCSTARLCGGRFGALLVCAMHSWLLPPLGPSAARSLPALEPNVSFPRAAVPPVATRPSATALPLLSSPPDPWASALPGVAIGPCVCPASQVINLVDGLSVAQGPNYGLAKRMQHWRACIAFEEGHTVSSMVAPSTATISVIHNRTFAWAYGGMPYFKYEIFKQETTNAVMAALLMCARARTHACARAHERLWHGCPVNGQGTRSHPACAWPPSSSTRCAFALRLQA